jgi:hypothetical protein
MDCNIINVVQEDRSRSTEHCNCQRLQLDKMGNKFGKSKDKQAKLAACAKISQGDMAVVR